jgi:hypothetical protein
VHTATGLAKDMVTYLWVPTEYFRNLIHASTALQGAIALATVAIIVGACGYGVRGHASRKAKPGQPGDDVDPATDSSRSAWLLLGLLGAYAIVGYLVLQITVIGFPPRTAFVALPLWSSAIGYLVDRLVAGRSASLRHAAVASAVVVAVGLDLWVLAAVHSIGPMAHSFL